MADLCFTVAYSQTFWVTGIPMHGTRVWPGSLMQWINACCIVARAFRALWGKPSPSEEQTFRPASHPHQDCNGVHADGTGTALTTIWMPKSEFLGEDKSWHVCILNVFVLSHALGSTINQQSVQAENSSLRALLCRESTWLISFIIPSGED